MSGRIGTIKRKGVRAPREDDLRKMRVPEWHHVVTSRDRTVSANDRGWGEYE